MSTVTSDVIDRLAGITPGSRFDELRARRPEARENAQKSYLALFEPDVPGNVTRLERHVVAAFVAGLHGQPAVAAFYATGLRALGRPDIADVVDLEVAWGAVEGPYGRYPQGPLSVEDRKGPDYRVASDHEAILGSRLVAALAHAHLLVFHPRDASVAALQSLLDAGWSTTDIVTLSQLVAFLSFQVRVVVGLRALAASESATDATAQPVFTALLASGAI